MKAFKGNHVGNQWSATLDPEHFKDRLVGIEIEVENAPGILLTDPEAPTRPPLVGATEWSAIKDGSLRNNGAEFVSFPMPVSRVESAVKSLFSFKTAHKMAWAGSVRTGIHVHVNVRDFDQAGLQNFLVTGTLIEPALFGFVGKDREECIYCVPWYRAPGDAKHAAYLLAPSQTSPFCNRLGHMTQSLAKYSSIFMAPITRIGTVEFRMAPTWMDEEKIVKWANICERVVSYAKCSPDYKTIIDSYDNSPSNWVSEVTGGHLQVPITYGEQAERLGSDMLARTLFPDTLEEWTRVLDAYIPPRRMSGKTHQYKPATYTLPADPVVLESGPFYVGQKLKDTNGIPCIWDGSKWREDAANIPHGTVKYLGGGKWRQWDVNLKMWRPKIEPTEIHAGLPGVSKSSWKSMYYTVTNSDTTQKLEPATFTIVEPMEYEDDMEESL